MWPTVGDETRAAASGSAAGLLDLARRQPVAPVTRLALLVGKRDHDQDIGLHQIHDPVREAGHAARPHRGDTASTWPNGAGLRPLRDGVDDLLDGSLEAIAQPGTTILVPRHIGTKLRKRVRGGSGPGRSLLPRGTVRRELIPDLIPGDGRQPTTHDVIDPRLDLRCPRLMNVGRVRRVVEAGQQRARNLGALIRRKRQRQLRDLVDSSGHCLSLTERVPGQVPHRRPTGGPTSPPG